MIFLVPIIIYLLSFLSLLLFDYELNFFCFISLRNNNKKVFMIEQLEKENKALKEDNITLKQQFEEDIEKICSSIKCQK